MSRSASSHAGPFAEPGPGSPRNPRGHRSAATRVVSAAGALIVHALLLLALAAVVWRTAGPATPRGPEINIDFEAPTAGDAARPMPGPAVPTDPPPPGEVALVMSPLSAPAPVPLDLPPIESLAALVPEPTELTSDRPAMPALDSSAFAATAASGDGPAAAPADLTTASSTARMVTFAGLGASNAQSVVYAIDASGSMVTSLPFVIAEVERSIAALSPTQKFGVVLFRKAAAKGGKGTEVFAPVLVRATPSARARLHDWLAHAAPSGRSVPLSGLERAFDYKPDAVFLLSRSIERSGGNVWERGLSHTLARVNELNPERNGRRAAVIQTIQFLDDDPTGIMQEIGLVHGARTDASGRRLAGYRVIRRGEELETPAANSGGGR